MTDLETRLRTTLHRVADDTTIPELQLDPAALPSGRIGPGHATGVEQRRRSTAGSLLAYGRRRPWISIIAVSAAVLAATSGAAVVTHQLGATVHSADPPAARSGIVKGRLPLCYGPGAGLNLSPRTTIRVVRDGHVVERRTFPSSVAHQTYQLVLPAGSYVLHTYTKPDLHVLVQAGHTTRADFRQPGCL